MREKITIIFIGAMLIFVLGGMLYMAIKYPREYPGYNHEYQPIYSPYPTTLK
jgi:hypothetical protein